jgi:hypothetical protein
MKKLWCAVLIALCAAASLAAQTDTSALSILNTSVYAEYFGTKNNRSSQVEIADEYLFSAPDADWEKFGSLGGEECLPDTNLEIALLTYYSQPVQNIRPVEAKNILPANTKTSELKLGAAVYQEMQMLRFLGNTDAAGRHEGIIKFITDRGNVSRAEIESYYRQGIGTLITEAVDTEFNKVEFLLKDSPNGSYGVVLTRNPQDQYVLSYEGYFNGAISTRTLPFASLESLLNTMRRNPGDFNQASIDHVRTQAGLMPAARLGKDSLNVIKLILEQFYLRPTVETYGYLKDVYALYNTGLVAINALYRNISSSYVGALSNLSQPLAQKVLDEHNAITLSNITLSREQQQRLLPNLQQ